MGPRRMLCGAMARPDLILHIGQSKTGTSSIQRCLGSRREALRAEGICYPASPGWANHGLLPASLVPLERLRDFNPHLWEGLAPDQRLERFRRDFAAELAAMGPDIRTVILSAEQCSGLLVRPEEIARLRDLLAPHVGRMRVVIYLRRQDQHFASSYTQALRTAVIRPPALPAQGPAEMPAYDYAALLDRWARVFGPEAMQPRIFARDAMLNGDAVDDFFDLCGIALRIPADDPERQSNLSVTPGGLGLMLAMGEHLGGRTPGGLLPSSLVWRRFTQAVSDILPGRGWRPKPEEASAFMARFQAVNEAVRQRWFPDRPRLFAEDYASAAGGLSTEASLQAACILIERETAAAQAREAQQHLHIGRLQERLGEAAAARRSFMAALRANPDSAEAHFALGRMDLTAGDVAAAEARCVALARCPQGGELAERLTRLLRRPRGEAAPA